MRAIGRGPTAGVGATFLAAVAAGALTMGAGCRSGTSGSGTTTTETTSTIDTHGVGKNGLELLVSKPTYAAGEQIVITVKLTNKSSVPCKMIQLTEGTVTIGSMTVNGKPVVPEMTTRTYINGMTEWLLSNLVVVTPGGSVSVPWVSQTWSSKVHDTLQTFTLARFDMADMAVWPVKQPGVYKLTVNYAVPLLDERAPKDLCRFTDTASIGFIVMGGN